LTGVSELSGCGSWTSAGEVPAGETWKAKLADSLPACQGVADRSGRNARDGLVVRVVDGHQPGAALAVAKVDSNIRSATTAGSALRINLFTSGPLWSGRMIRPP
jgi:hypothetical protein